ncbi:23S rRNA (uracil(1939)-C(5))-methyltransferase RlmD [Carboxydochorda subterranea]|uniref:23S rRNA (Uracil(1939)-C(5))-methyltransferase RlmD n=1 Tax=Carboxydichorda subterranea TaxID=3109565 RepID=A0ABZ1BZE7_9FIRM|nr:23S rRNA (uracil(1939)-C(5))-methyltransferase RlmD [Limnochorda sp. L945t]WRP18177.1 23S rRNA (uracil(1939)-C(5))-methyltransferase RlmD [Limnochorda sp. L945t]
MSKVPSGAPGEDAPEVGQRLVLDVASLDPRGDGVARTPGGFVVFVEGGLPGDRVEAVVSHRARHHARARLARQIRPSPLRVEGPCPVAETCGGCPLIHLAYPAQLEAKRSGVQDALVHTGGLEEAASRVLPVRGMEVPWGYRNKAQYPVGRGHDGRPVIGFYRRGTHEVVEALDCRVQHPLNVRLARATRDAIEELSLPPYDEATGSGLVRHLVCRTGAATGEALLVVVTARDGPEVRQALGQLAERVRRRVPELVGVVQNVNPLRTNVVLGKRSAVVWGREFLEERVGAVRLRLSATAFFQVNTRQAEVLYGEVRRRVETFLEARGQLGRGTLLDLYCGVGGIGIAASDRVGRLIGVEEVQEAVDDARRNAELNGVRHARWVAGDVEEVLPRLLQEGGERMRPLLVVVDPPRKGLDAAVVRALVRAQPELLVYVSCHPVTLARDLRQFVKGVEAQGLTYRWDPVQPVDMFPQTAHVEVVASLWRA